MLLFDQAKDKKLTKFRKKNIHGLRIFWWLCHECIIQSFVCTVKMIVKSIKVDMFC